MDEDDVGERGSVKGVEILGCYFVSPTLKNFGPSPALRLLVDVVWEIVPFSAKDKELLVPETNTHPASTIVPAGELYATDQVILNPRQTADFRAMRIKVLVSAQVQYDDIFSGDNKGKRIHTTLQHFCVEHGGGTFVRDGVEQDYLIFKPIGHSAIVT